MTEQTEIGAIFAPGMGPVRPQLRGPEGARLPVADFERMRAIAIATKELAARGYLEDSGFIIPSGAATANEGEVMQAFDSRPGDMANLAEAHKVRISTQGEEGTMTPREFLEAFPFHKNRQTVQRIRGKPASEAETARVKETTEAGLMRDLLAKARVKPDVTERVTIPQEVIEENEAKNTIENVVRNINALDRKAGGVWEGTIAVVTSNFGHISRIEEILKAFGIDEKNVVGLSAEQVLRHFGYDKTYLDRYESQNVNTPTIQNQERWRRGVREVPAYVLPEVALFENDERLMQVMGGLRDWYGQDKLTSVHPELARLDELTPQKLREILLVIPRKKPPEEWGKEADVDAWREEIAAYTIRTENYLTSHNPSRA